MKKPPASASAIVAILMLSSVSTNSFSFGNQESRKKGFNGGMQGNKQGSFQSAKKGGRKGAMKAGAAFTVSDKWQHVKDPVDFYFPGYDKDNDGHLSEEEWNNRGNFNLLDGNDDGFIDRKEFKKLYTKTQNPVAPPIILQKPRKMDSTIQEYRITAELVGKKAVCTITRTGLMGVYKCDKGNEIARSEGLIETGLGPVFPEGGICKGIDETYALSYIEKTGQGMHGGIDIPTDFGTPILAVADGTVVGIFDPEINARGKTIVLRHSPEDTGLPFWIYTEYAHLDAMPKQIVGQRVKMGEVLGPTGNSGISRKNKRGISTRRPGIHLAVYYSQSPKFAEIPNYIVPAEAKWMDSNALYRLEAPYDSESLLKLPSIEKKISIPVIFEDGTIKPENTKLIWPYACQS